MKKFFACIVLGLAVVVVFATPPVDANENESFEKTLSILPVILNAIDDFDREHPLLPGDTLTYGKMIKSGQLPDFLCEKTIRDGTCGSVSVENEAVNVKAPPITMFDTFAVVRIIVPFWNIEEEHLKQLSRVVEGHSAIVATWNHPEGDIPVVLKETRKGALRQFIRYIRREQTKLGSKMTI